MAPADAALKKPSFIRDAEVENTIRAYATPLFRAAGLRAENVKIYIVKDNTINAFVAGGKNLFLNTGLLLQSTDANEVIGVIAHETGHIAGGHLSRIPEALAKGSAASILGFILGGAAALATGRGDLGAAIAMGGQSMATRNFLAFSRAQEGAADHAAMKFLDQSGQSSRGLRRFLARLEDQELLSAARQDPYLQTHPITGERIAAINQHIKDSPFSDTPSPAPIRQMQARMKAKLVGFLYPLARTLRIYKDTDNSVPSRYARAIARYRQPDLEKALVLIDGLIADEPDNPYFHELKGQMLFENGRLAGALDSYGRAARLLPDSALIRRDLARAQIEYNQPQMIDAAIINLESALASERNSPFNWRLLAIAHGRKGNLGRSSLALAEEALLNGKSDVARYHAGRAMTIFPRGSREWLQAEDIQLAAEAHEEQEKKKPSR